MARTQAADYEQRRDAILDRAADLFAAKGFDGASVADLAAACAISKSLIYHYYPSKEDILYGVMASHIEALVAVVTALEGETSDPRDRLRALIARFVEIYVGAAARQKVLLNDLDRLPAPRRAAIVARQRGLVAALSAILAEIQPALQRDPHRLTATTMLLFGMINWTKTWFHPNGPITPAALADLATTLVLEGLS